MKAVRLALVRLRLVGLLALVALAIASADTLSSWARGLTSNPTKVRQNAGVYVCPMHPEAAHDAPGKCASCGMELRLTAARAAGPPRVELTALQAQRGGIALARVERRKLSKEVRAPATLEADERRTVRVATRLKGLVEQVYVSGAGDRVNKGARLLLLQAPDLLAFTGELLKERVSATQYPVALQRLRLKLRAMGVSRRQIEQLEKSGDLIHLTVESPISGTILDKQVLPGDLVQEGAALFTIADLSHLYLVARLSQEDALLVAPGAAVELEVQGLRFAGQVSRIDPALDKETHTLGVRAAIDNSEGLLRPGMYGRASFHFSANESLSVPLSAVVETGARQYVWREDSAGRYQQVEVTVSGRSGLECAIESDLAEGDKIVVEGAFALSAEARLKTAPTPAAGERRAEAP